MRPDNGGGLSFVLNTLILYLWLFLRGLYMGSFRRWGGGLRQMYVRKGGGVQKVRMRTGRGEGVNLSEFLRTY